MTETTVRERKIANLAIQVLMKDRRMPRHCVRVSELMDKHVLVTLVHPRKDALVSGVIIHPNCGIEEIMNDLADGYAKLIQRGC